MTIDAKDLNAEERALWDRLAIDRFWHEMPAAKCYDLSRGEALDLLEARRVLFSPEPAAEPEPPESEHDRLTRAADDCAAAGENGVARRFREMAAKVEPAPVEGELPWQVRHTITKLHEQKLVDLDAVAEDLEVWARSLKPQAVELPSLVETREIVSLLLWKIANGCENVSIGHYVSPLRESKKELDALPKPAPKVMSEALRMVLGLAEIGWSKAKFDGNFGLMESGSAAIAAVRGEYGEPGGKGGE